MSAAAKSFARPTSHVLITGASSGLGAGLARAYAADGACIGLLGRDRQRLEQVADEVAQAGGTAWSRVVDVTDTAAMESAIRSFSTETGDLDVVIANAGVGEGVGSARYDAAQVAEVVRINVLGVTNTLLPAVPLLRERGGGTLVGMASLAGYGALPGSVAYSATKSFVITFLRGLQLELELDRIHAMSVCPGFVRTPMTDKNHFAMPFLLDCDVACRKMKRAIDARKSRYAFPLPTALGIRILTALPAGVVRKIVPKPL